METHMRFISSCARSNAGCSRLCELDGRDRPPAFMASDLDPQAMELIQEDMLDRSRFAVTQCDCFAHEFHLRLFELAENREGSRFDGNHRG
jgi:hypothetical protein